MNKEYEILTSTGWKNITTINDFDKIATLDPQMHAVEWDTPLLIYKTPFDGDLINISNKHISIQLPLDHHIFTKPNVHGIFSIEKLKDSLHLLQYYKKNGFNVIPNIPTYTLPKFKYNEACIKEPIIYNDLVMNMNSWLEFLGIYLSCGYQTDIKHFVQFNINRKCVLNKLLNIQSVLNILIEYNETTDFNFIYDVRLYNYLAKFGTLKDRTMPPYALLLSADQSWILLNALLMNNNTSMTINTKYNTPSKIMADCIQILAFNACCTADIIYIDIPSTNKYVNIANEKTYCVTITDMITYQEPTINMAHHTVIPYSGDIYHLSVQNRIFMSRHNNKYYWLGT